MDLPNFLLHLLSNFLNFLAWPSFPLVYTLYVSIRAVESDERCQKCLAYWVLFSIATILESVVGNLLLRLPFWPYLRGILTLLLVTPSFNGASYVYRHFISPHFSKNLEVNDCLLIPQAKDYLTNEHNSFLDEAERHITARSEEKLVKPVVYEDECIAKYSSGGSSLAWRESPKRLQKEWSCALCLVTTTSQKCLTHHFQGKKHKAMEEELIKEAAVANRGTNLLGSFNHITWVNLERLSCLLTPVARSIRWCRWKKPEFGWTKLNTDGSIDRDNVGFGGLFRDSNGDPLCAYVSKAPGHDIFLVELWAIWRGLVLALGIGIRVIWVESDSLSVVNTINRKQPYGPKASSCLKHIWDILKKFDKYRVTHSWRETNRAADHLAKMDLLGSDIVLWPKDFPDSLYKIIKDDAQGKRDLSSYRAHGALILWIVSLLAHYSTMMQVVLSYKCLKNSGSEISKC